MRHGKGQLIYHKDNGAKFAGTFNNDELQQGEFVDSEGNVFKSLKHPDSNKGNNEIDGVFYKGRLCGYG
jgi:hypothetical protein